MAGRGCVRTRFFCAEPTLSHIHFPVAKKILLVDDEEPMRKVMRVLLKAESHWELHECADGQEALDFLCDGFRPDLCLIDLDMPRMGGLELIQRIRHDPALQGLQVIVVSANKDKDVITSLVKLRIAGYLLKPYDTSKVRAMLHNLSGLNSSSPAPLSRNLLAKTALVAEPDREQRRSIADFIKQTPDWEVIAVSGGDEALEHLVDGTMPDVIIIGMDTTDELSLETIRKIRANPQLAKLPVIVSATNADRQGVMTLAGLKISSLLPKPVCLDDIKALLAKVTQ